MFVLRINVIFHSGLDDIARSAVLRTIESTFSVEVQVIDLDGDVEELIENFYVAWRGQYEASSILETIARVYPNDIFLFVVPFDIFVEGLNFVFGVALPRIGAVISTARFKSSDRNVYVERIYKTVKHELGHVFGLEHCRNPCVMRFANSIMELDMKPKYFCEKCAEKLMGLGVLKQK